MSAFLDSVPFSGIIRIRDMMYTVDRPFRLDQGDVSFDAPDSLKNALIKGVHENRTHYVQTTGIPPLVDLLVKKLREKNRIPVGSPDEVMVTSMIYDHAARKRSYTLLAEAFGLKASKAA